MEGFDADEDVSLFFGNEATSSSGKRRRPPTYTMYSHNTEAAVWNNIVQQRPLAEVWEEHVNQLPAQQKRFKTLFDLTMPDE